jgi:uncharacterized DUF497 family protein
MEFEWDPDKARSNLFKHGVRFEEATDVFEDPYRIEIYDQREGYGEDRWKIVGRSGLDVLSVVYTTRQAPTGESYRLISARKATQHEEAEYCQIQTGQGEK